MTRETARIVGGECTRRKRKKRRDKNHRDDSSIPNNAVSTHLQLHMLPSHHSAQPLDRRSPVASLHTQYTQFLRNVL